ncbi:MAG: protein phosphatase 2C domain-containing protein [Xenococcus sp. MO_188.B8]|nr:protein phosphatase 2C domain-containing protein [Xenococcus sp. MO_188.B8]
MRLKIIDKKSDYRGQINEDLVGNLDSHCWVLDGATGLTDNPVTNSRNDARWFVERIDASLRKFCSFNDTSLQEVVFKTIIQVDKEFQKCIIKSDHKPFEVPSAGMALIKIDEGYLEYGVLGDCRIFILKESGEKISIGGSPLEKLDQEVVKRILELRDEKGIKDYGEIKTQILPLLQKNRSLMNTDEGYWILSLNPEASNHMNQGTIKVMDGDVVLLVTDGFYRIVDIFKKVHESELVQVSLERGFEDIIEELRAMEQADFDCLKYPRLKVSDDATAVLLRISALPI